MKNNNQLTHHYIETRNLISQAEESIAQVTAPILHTSEQFQRTSETYTGHKSTLQKSNFYLNGLTKQHKINIIIVYGSFFFLVMVVGFIVLRRLFYRNFYSDLSSYVIQMVKNGQDL